MTLTPTLTLPQTGPKTNPNPKPNPNPNDHRSLTPEANLSWRKLPAIADTPGFRLWVGVT